MEFIMQLILFFEFCGIAFFKACVLMFPIFAAVYFVHALYNRKPLKQILKEILP